MTERYQSLAERREKLVAQSTIQREQFAALVADVWQPGALLTGKNILMQARQKPLLSGVMAILTILFFRKRRLFSILAIGAVVIKTWSQLSSSLLPILNKLKPFRQKKLK
ncbi:MAG: hypothetical protein FWG01_04635 [Betaproteobacteria bacterium]|nr:hypothetical protein [Betaproteobacteria bacterium]